MIVKKLLIIQQDEAYFLFETLLMLEKFQSQLRDFSLTVLVDDQAMKVVYDKSSPIINCLTTDADKIKQTSFDVSVNFSLNDKSALFHGDIDSSKKLGAYYKNNSLQVDDLWSTYLLTLKARAPFLTFHLRDIYRNILGLKYIFPKKFQYSPIKQIALGTTNPNLFSSKEQESLIYELALSYPHFPLKDISEIDLIEDVSGTLYIGPANLEALKFCEAGGKGIFLSSAFQGFNLLPYSGNHKVLSTKGGSFKASDLLEFVEKEIANQNNLESTYSVYTYDDEMIHGAYLQSRNNSDDQYPFYQAHVVLWDFLLNLHDSHLIITDCSKSQLQILTAYQQVLSKYIRLHDYALVSVDTIFKESKLNHASGEKIEGHLKNLIEVDKISDQISESHSLLRPVLDFYRIRRGQGNGLTLHEQAQHSLLAYSEEHQALEALVELFSVTLRKNEVNI
jgi:hypothetical protein